MIYNYSAGTRGSGIPSLYAPVAGMPWLVLIILPLILLALHSCGSPGQAPEGRIMTDSAGREVTIPDTVRTVIALKSGTMRLLSYLKVTHLVSHIEGSEQRRNVQYLFANPHLRELPVIGAGNNYDTELLTIAAPDLILATFMSPREADRLQRITRRPVMLLEYGDLGVRKEKLYETLTMLGEVFYRKERADTLIQFIETTIEECSRRSGQYHGEPRSAYIGGVAYNGAHGINSTEPDYPPFEILKAANVAAGLGLRGSSDAPGHEVVFIDPEQIIEWDPDILFLDAAGRQIWEKELQAPSVFSMLKAVRAGEVYTVLPYNWNSTNYENLLCNIWYIGSVLMPGAFYEADVEEKCREVFHLFYGVDIYDQTIDYYRPFRRYMPECVNKDQS